MHVWRHEKKNSKFATFLRYCCTQSNSQRSQEISHLQAALQHLNKKETSPSALVLNHLLNTCVRLKASSEAKQLHDRLCSWGNVDSDASLGLSLLTMHSKLERVDDARFVFERMPEKRTIAWTLIIGAYARTGHPGPAFHLLKRMLLEGSRPCDITFIHALTACCGPADLPEGSLIHSLIRESRIGDSKVAVWNTIVSMYGKCGSLESAIATFESMPVRDVVSWSIVITACSRYENCERQVLRLFQEMQLEGFIPKDLTLGVVLHACARLESLEQGKLIHQSLAQSGFKLSNAVGTALINLYGKSNSLDDACEAFDAMEEPRCIVSWNSMMSVFIQRGRCRRAVSLFQRLHQEGLNPTKATYITILGACNDRCFLATGRRIHSSLVESGYGSDSLVENALISMYDACGSLKEAELVFHKIKIKSSVSWNVMLAAELRHSQVDRANILFRRMMQEFGKPDRVTLVLLLNSCNSLREVERFHDYIRQRGDESHGILGSALVTLHGRYGRLEEARRIFVGLQFRDIVSWNGMIGACANSGCPNEAWELYKQLRDSGVAPTTVTYVAVLDACTRMVAVEKGREIHSSIPESRLKTTSEIGISLINLYGKCGTVAEAKLVFDCMETRDVVLWSSLIAAFSQLGHWDESLMFVKMMQLEGVEPNQITYVSVMSACSHAGLVEEAYDYFLEMSRGYGIQPTRDHYRCVVDLLARAGRLDEAEKLLTGVENMGPVAWMTLLAACKNQGDGARARRAAKLAIKFNPESSAGYIALFNTYIGSEEEELDLELADDVNAGELQHQAGVSLLQLS